MAEGGLHTNMKFIPLAQMYKNYKAALLHIPLLYPFAILSLEVKKMMGLNYSPTLTLEVKENRFCSFYCVYIIK